MPIENMKGNSIEIVKNQMEFLEVKTLIDEFKNSGKAFPI